MPEDVKDTTDFQATFISAFIAGAVSTFDVQCSYSLKPAAPHKFDPNESIPTDICSIIGLTSNAFCGVISLCFSKELFTHAMSNMLGEKIQEINDEISDGAGELLNVIFGAAKTALNNEGVAVEKALPTVIRGTGLKVNSLTGGAATITIPMLGEHGNLFVLVSLGKSNKPSLMHG